MSKEDQIGAGVSLSVHILLLLFALWYTIDINPRARTSYIEVTLGDFKSGMPAEYAEQKNEEVAKQPNPSKVEPEDPTPEEPEDVEKKTEESTEQTKTADLPDQQQPVDEEPVKTPDTKKIEPEEQPEKQQKEEESVPPKTEEAPEKQEGAETSGSKKGNTGSENVDQGTGSEKDKSAPYELKWEGDIERTPMVRPLPENPSNREGVITVRFEVKPNGRVGRIQPLRKMNPDLEREVMSTLRSWRFSDLPSGVPQESQWGVITFRFVLE